MQCGTITWLCLAEKLKDSNCGINAGVTLSQSWLRMDTQIVRFDESGKIVNTLSYWCLHLNADLTLCQTWFPMDTQICSCSSPFGKSLTCQEIPKGATEGTYLCVHRGSISGQCDATLKMDKWIAQCVPDLPWSSPICTHKIAICESTSSQLRQSMTPECHTPVSHSDTKIHKRTEKDQISIQIQVHPLSAATHKTIYMSAVNGGFAFYQHLRSHRRGSSWWLYNALWMRFLVLPTLQVISVYDLLNSWWLHQAGTMFQQWSHRAPTYSWPNILLSDSMSQLHF